MPQADSQDKSYPRSCRKDYQGPPSLTALPHRHGLLSPQAGACPLWEQECWEEAPPGSAGVPPACASVAFRSVSLRCGTRPRCRRVRHGLGRSRVLAPMPVEPYPPTASAFAIWRYFAASRLPPPHQPSPAARLLRLPLKGGVIEFYWKPCAGLNHSPLEGESVRQGLRPQSNRWGGRNRRDRHIGDPARNGAGGRPQSPRLVRGPCFTLYDPSGRAGAALV